MREDLQARLIGELVLESNEALDQFDQELLTLEKTETEASDETLNVMFRAIHSLKGSSGCLGLTQIESLAHAGESLLSLLRERLLSVTPRIITILLACSDGLRAMLSHLHANGAEGSHNNASLISDLRLLAELQSDGEKPVIEPYGLFEDLPPEPVLAAPAINETVGVKVAEVREPAEVVRTTNLPPPAVTESAIRVDVHQLDGMMDLVGELVLARNQIMQFSGILKDSTLLNATQRLNMITTKLQEKVMKTRMQPIGNIWSKFPRIVRDISRDLGKEVRLVMEGKETDLDRNIIEAIKDPLTHLVRNSIDHGLETPAQRIAAGKLAEGQVRLRAFHEGGQVNIEIYDGGAGIDREKVLKKAIERHLVQAALAPEMSDREVFALLFAPGFSTADKVTNLSGRGVGLDVVKNNIERIGGSVSIQSEVGKTTTVRIRIPLTLAIIPALIINCGAHRYAIPQVSLVELVGIDPEQASKQVEYIGGAPVYRLRGNLLPLVYLSEQLKVEPGVRAADASVFLLVLQAEGRQFGLVVDAINDTEEIVVKPLGKELKGLSIYAGATIMGDGCVSLILDVLGLARFAGIMQVATGTENGMQADAQEKNRGAGTRSSMLIFSLGNDRQAAIALSHVARLEEFDRGLIETGCNCEVIQYRGEIMPLVRLANVLGMPEVETKADDRLRVIVYSHHGKSVGFVVHRILDTVDEEVDLQRTSSRPGILGSAVIRKRVYLGAELFGIEVLKVQEVMQHQVMTAVPLAPKVVRGLMNLRGSIVSCIDLRLRFEMPPAPPEIEPIHVVTQTDGGLVSFQVDRIGDVVEITDASFEPAPSTLKGEARKLIDGVYKLKNALLLIVNVPKVLELEANY